MRRCNNGILSALIEYVKTTEIPSLFSIWCGLSAISACLGRSCSIDMGHYIIYPNLYIILVAGSGKCKKSAAIGVIEKLITQVQPEIRIFSQKATPEALIGSLSGTTTNIEENIVYESAEGIIIADELPTLLDARAQHTGLIQFLTTLWDSRDYFSYETRSRGKEEIRNACVNLLGGTTIDWIKEAISITAVGGGFTARIIFVFMDTSEKLILRTKTTPRQKELLQDILNDLNEVRKMHGMFEPTQEAWDYLDNEYRVYMNTSPMHKNKYLSGYANKRMTNLLKLCMAVAASTKNDMVITKSECKTAKDILEYAEVFMPHVLMAIASDDRGVESSHVIEIIRINQKITRKKLLNSVHHRMQAADLDTILDTLEQAGVVSRVVRGGQEHITLLEDPTKPPESDMSFTERILQGVF